MDRTSSPPFPGEVGARRTLFADNEPFASGYLKAGVHEIYYEECGNPQGRPVAADAQQDDRGNEQPESDRPERVTVAEIGRACDALIAAGERASSLKVSPSASMAKRGSVPARLTAGTDRRARP